MIWEAFQLNGGKGKKKWKKGRKKREEKGKREKGGTNMSKTI